MIKVAIIGAGYMANEHIKAFSSLENVMVNGIFSRTKEKAIIISKKYKIEFVAESINELYNLTKADVVVNTSSVASILDTTKKCLNFPWINLVEKPPGYNLNEALTLYELVEKKNAQLYVALNRRHYSSVKKALFELKNDDSKRVVKVLDQEDQNDPKRIGHSNKIIQNWMFANSIHLIDYFSIFCRGNLTDVQQVVPWDPSDPSFVAAKLVFDSGDIGIYECFWNSPAPWSVSITTKSMRLDMTPLESLTKQSYGSREKVNIELDEIDLKFKPGINLQAREIIKLINSEKSNLPNLEDAIKTMQLVQLIYFKS